MVKTYLKTDIGLRRSENQDALGERDLALGKIVVVCDGMGGHYGGFQAANLATHAILQFFEEASLKYLQEETAETLFSQAIVKASQALAQFTKENERYKRMGTTLVVGWLAENILHFAHIGDSRLYLFREGELRRLTKDHSPVQEMVDVGLLKEDEMDRHPKSNLINKYIGAAKVLEYPPTVTQIEAHPNDLYLLCTDGLNSMLSQKEMEEIMAVDISIADKTTLLIKKANEAGGKDNISVALMEVLGN